MNETYSVQVIMEEAEIFSEGKDSCWGQKHEKKTIHGEDQGKV
jgi:hypothetical protein